MMLSRFLIAGAIAWPLWLGASAWRMSSDGAAGWPAVTYLTASVLCHQRADRSFHSAGVQWPVCARCSGLYLAAPIGALAIAIAAPVRRWSRSRVLTVLGIAGAPTAILWLVEWGGLAPIGNVARFAGALPLGAAVAAVLVHTAHRLD